jgi:signal transduction histidine kinase
MLLGLFFYAFFGVLDTYYYSPQVLKTAVLLRFGVAIPLLTCCYLATFHPVLKSHFLWFMAAFVIIAIAGINCLIAIATPVDKAYDFWFVGLLLVMFWTHNSGFSSWTIIGIYIYILVTYNITAIVFQQLHSHSPAILFGNNGILATAIVVSYISHGINELYIAHNQKANEELKDAATLKEQILSVISHDVRGPVASIMGLLNLSARGLITSQELKDNSQNLTASIESLQGLLDTIFVWTMDQNENFPLVKTNVNVRDVVIGVFKVFNPYIKRKSIELQNHVEGHVTVHADLTMLNIILRGIVSNVFKFASGTTISFSAVETLSHTSIYIQYWQPGVIKEIEQMLKVRAKDVSWAENGKAFVLGICKDLVEKKHGGTFTAESNPIDGTIICCRFPKTKVVTNKKKAARYKATANASVDI